MVIALSLSLSLSLSLALSIVSFVFVDRLTAGLTDGLTGTAIKTFLNPPSPAECDINKEDLILLLRRRPIAHEFADHSREQNVLPPARYYLSWKMIAARLLGGKN
jgi:hypothetical protein